MPADRNKLSVRRQPAFFSGLPAADWIAALRSQ
jgi:hypothetical protein